jgi:hypothetical protein
LEASLTDILKEDIIVNLAIQTIIVFLMSASLLKLNKIMIKG